MQKWIYDESYGTEVFKLAINDDRLNLFKKIINNKLADLEEEDSNGKMGKEKLTESAQTLYSRYHEIEDILRPEIKTKLLPHFTDWLTKKVILIGIKVPTEQDAHKVFVTMNDRGLNLSPTEMLKGFLLSNIKDSNKRDEAHKIWREYIHKLEKFGKEEDSNFIKNWLRGQYADGMRERKRGAEKRDFELIGESYHKWVYDNKENIGLKTTDDYFKFVTKAFKKFAETYIFIKKYSKEFNSEFADIFYNSNRQFPLQILLIFGALKKGDSEPHIKKKMKLISKFIDFYITIRIVNNQNINYNTIIGAMFNLVKKIRSKSYANLKQVLIDEIKKLDYELSNFENLSYSTVKTSHLLHILARIGAFVDEKATLTNGIAFTRYVNRKKANKTYDIEHVLANKFLEHKHGQSDMGSFSDKTDFDNQRNRIGGLVLLPRDINRSLRDMAYDKKLAKYLEQNILTKTLCKGFYINNPKFKKFLVKFYFDVASMDSFNKESIKKRGWFYKQIALKIWNPKNLK